MREPEMIERKRDQEEAKRQEYSDPGPTAPHLIFILFHFRYCMSSVCNEWRIKWLGGDERMERKGWRTRLIRSEGWIEEWLDDCMRVN